MEGASIDWNMRVKTGGHERRSEKENLKRAFENVERRFAQCSLVWGFPPDEKREGGKKRKSEANWTKT